MNADDISEVMERCFVSEHELGSGVLNVTEVIDRVAINLGDIASAITPGEMMPMNTPDGGRVGSLTEAVIYAAKSLSSIAAAIGDLADAVRDRS